MAGQAVAGQAVDQGTLAGALALREAIDAAITATVEPAVCRERGAVHQRMDCGRAGAAGPADRGRGRGAEHAPGGPHAARGARPDRGGRGGTSRHGTAGLVADLPGPGLPRPVPGRLARGPALLVLDGRVRQPEQGRRVPAGRARGGQASLSSRQEQPLAEAIGLPDPDGYGEVMAGSGHTPYRDESPGKLTSKGAQTRERIVAAAAELMFEGGVAGTTLEMVRAAARVSSSQVYHYFADKENLVRAVIAYQNETIVGGQEPMPARLDSLDGIRAWRDSLVEHQRQLGCRGGCPIGAPAASWPRSTRRPGPPWPGGSAAGKRIRGGFQAMARPGELAPDASPGRLATTMLAARRGACC